MKNNLYVFQWISDLGGADTRLKELLILLSEEFNITCIPNDEFRLKEKHNTDFLDKLGVKYCMPDNLPKKLNGYAYANCNFRLFKEKNRIDFIKDSGLKFLWSNDMMWTTGEEIDAIKNDKVDCCLFTSKFHYDILGSKIVGSHKTQKTFIVDNYFDSNTWQYYSRPNRTMVCGKVSRDDQMKFSENFPVFYESACDGIETKFKVMGWSDELSKKYSWFNFDSRWEFLKTNAVNTSEFLNSIDVFLYNCNHRFIENQSRAIIEAQLTGCPIVAPNRWNFPNMIWNTRTGLLWNDLTELREGLRDLNNFEFRSKMGKLASQYTRDIWCDKNKALDQFNQLINYIS